jgi:uncharacterized protein with PQ loop repeat
MVFQTFLSRLLELAESHDSLVETLLNLFMMTGPVLPFIPQMRLIVKEQNMGNFSILTCFILITANFLRILFWYKSLNIQDYIFSEIGF